ncbi:hypothetical protein CLCR_07808 [Cladophialophora carrionii]|uniref:Uncharacterized protein n=1 Tax=Cladophialophora carrionii TaxID=86049 RepID=A0A1C1CNP9_9EURO|nr:hypothetical protein CLCR_07808 [Cladophialophora carrionii]
MSTPTHSFLTLIPATHRVATMSPFTSPIEGPAVDESLVPALQKTRRSSSTTSTGCASSVEDPTLASDMVESPVEGVKSPEVVAHKFLKLGN